MKIKEYRSQFIQNYFRLMMQAKQFFYLIPEEKHQFEAAHENAQRHRQLSCH
jgi:hypothetical protein